jgi:putative ABC transport system permease protein
MAALPAVFGKLLPVHATLDFPWRSVAAGLGTGLLTTLLFCLPPLLDVRNVRPVLVLRRLVEQGPEGIGGRFAQWWARRLQLGISVVVIAALGGIAWALSESVTVGGWFALLFTIALVVLLALAAAALRALRFFLNRVRLRLPSFLRQGLANLYRPGNQSAAVLASLGTGVMLILTVFLVQAALLRDLREARPQRPVCLIFSCLISQLMRSQV